MSHVLADRKLKPVISDYYWDSFFGMKLNNVNEVISQFRVGIEVSIAERLRNELGLTTVEFSHQIGISGETYGRRKKHGRMNTYESEKIFRIYSMLNMAVDVLKNRQEAIRWLMTKKRALNYEVPLEFCDTFIGYEEALNLLGRIEYGVYS